MSVPRGLKPDWYVLGGLEFSWVDAAYDGLTVT